MRRRGRRRHDDILTPREWEVLDLLRQGLTNEQIAARLGVTHDTAKFHVSEILSKLGVRDRREAAAWPQVARWRQVPALLALLRQAPGKAGALVLLTGVIAVFILFAAGVVLSRSKGGVNDALIIGGSPSPTATEAAGVPPTPTPFPYVAPQRLDFAAGELINVSPAVLFADPATGASTVWAFSEWTLPEFAVGPSGDYVIYGSFLEPPRASAESRIEYRLLRTADASDRVVEIDSLPVEFGPGDSGFIALVRGSAAVAVFDGQGDVLFEVPLPGEFLAAAWSYSGGMVALASRQGSDRYELVIHRLEDGAQVSLISDSLAFEGAPLSLECSHAGQELAVVAPNRVFVMQPRGNRLWEAPGDIYWSNPRWSPDDSYLFVNGWPGYISGTTEPEVDYVFNNQGVPLFRILSSYVGGCTVDPWLSDTELQLHTDVWSIDGEIVAQAPSNIVYPGPSLFDVNVDPAIGYHLPHGGTDTLHQTDDGRLVLSTPEVGHGGCGTSVAGSFDGPVVQRPPFGGWVP